MCRARSFPSLAFMTVCWGQAPKLGAHLKEEGVYPTMYCSHWFITILSYTLPFDHLLRVWDVFFLEGTKTIFRLGPCLVSDLRGEEVGGRGVAAGGGSYKCPAQREWEW